MELDAAVVRPAHQVDVAGGRVGGDAHPVGQRAVGAGRRRCCRSRRLLAAPVDRGRPATACPGRRCPCRRAGSPAGRRAPGGPGRPRGTGWPRASSPSIARANAAIFGWSPSRGSPGPGPTMTRSWPSSAPGRSPRAGPPSRSCPARQSTWRSMLTKSSSPSRITTDLPLSSGAGGDAALVGEPELREPLVAGGQRDEHVLVAGQVGDALGGRGRRVDEPERGQDAAGLGVGLGDLVRRVGVAHQRGTGGDLEPPVERRRRRCGSRSGQSAVGAPSSSRPSSARAAP